MKINHTKDDPLKGERRRIIEQIREEERKRITDHILVNSHTVKEGTFVWTKDILAFINEQ